MKKIFSSLLLSQVLLLTTAHAQESYDAENTVKNHPDGNYQRDGKPHEDIDQSAGQMDPEMKRDKRYYYPGDTHSNFYHYGEGSSSQQ